MPGRVSFFSACICARLAGFMRHRGCTHLRRHPSRKLMINPDRLTVKATEALNEAVDLARRAGNPLVYDLHLLMALLTQDEGIVVPILQKLGVSVTQLRETVGREMARYPKQSNAQPTLSRELNQRSEERRGGKEGGKRVER